MAENINGYALEFLIHPGETLKEVLEDREMTQNELAIRTGFTPKHISTVIKGKKGISPNLAKNLEYALDIDASFWCNLQNNYEQEIIELNQANNISKNELEILKHLKEISAYFVEKRAIEECDSESAIILKLRKILNVGSLTYIPQLSMQGAFRASGVNKVDPYVLCAWQKICELKMEEMSVENQLDINLLKQYIPQIKRLMFQEPNTMRRELQEIFAKCGIAFNIVKHFKGAPVQGFIKKTDDGKILLCITLRQSFADIFWFTLFHEIAHILNGDVKNYFFDFDFTKDEVEKKADELASDMLISKKSFEKFKTECNYTNLESIKDFAVQENIPIYIVIGRLQKEKLIDYSTHTDMKVRYKWA